MCYFKIQQLFVEKAGNNMVTFCIRSNRAAGWVDLSFQRNGGDAYEKSI